MTGTISATEHGTRAEDPASDKEWIATTRALRAVDEQRYPRTTAAREELFSGTPKSRLAWNFQVLLNGILATSVPH
ncbi:MAG TPA: hypothetical protein VH372_17470 [Actinospica sp.]|nr:hypothetical protein [Actinospica sp.]